LAQPELPNTKSVKIQESPPELALATKRSTFVSSRVAVNGKMEHSSKKKSPTNQNYRTRSVISSPKESDPLQMQPGKIRPKRRILNVRNEKRAVTIMSDYEETQQNNREKVVRSAMSGYRNHNTSLNTPCK